MKQHIEFDIEFKKNTYQGKFFVIEGIDGSGKTTQCNSVTERLGRNGFDVICTKEPTDGEIGKLIRRVLSAEVKVPPAAIQYLLAADRAVHQEEIISYLSKKTSVSSDRYFWSAIAYGIADRGDVDFASEQAMLVAHSILSMYHQFLIPDKTLYLDVSIDTALSRLGAMDKEKEIYEKREKLEKIDAGYKWLISTFPEQFVVIDAEQPVEKVTHDMLNALTPLFA